MGKKKKKTTVFKSPGISMYDSDGPYVNWKGFVEKIIEKYPEVFLDDDLPLQGFPDLEELWKEKYRDKRLNKLLD